MKKNIVNVLLGVFAAIVLVVAGCGRSSSGSGSGTAAPAPDPAPSIITDMAWYFQNEAPDYSNNGVTCTLTVILYYSESIAAGDIQSFSVTLQNGWQWTIASNNIRFGTSSSGKPYVSAKLYYGDNPQAFPLAGTWIARIKLTNGMSSGLQKTFHEKGSSADATHGYLYTKEDWAPSTNPSQYVTSLGRFPAEGYTVQYSASNGGTITTSGLSAIRSGYLATESSAYNLVCLLYDINKAYLGYTTTEYSLLDRSPSNLITADGELSILPVSAKSSTGQVDLSKVKYIRFVYNDGAQYAPSSYASFDYRSISSLVAVN